MRPQRSNISQSLRQFNSGVQAYLLEGDHTIAAPVHFDVGARLLSSRTGHGRLRHSGPEARVYSMQDLPIERRSVDRARGRRPYKPERAQIALALSGNACHILGMKVLGVDAEEHRANGHAG